MKRYSVCFFPSLHGTPWDTDSWLVARWYAFVRNLGARGIGEVRIIDNETNKHYVI